MASLVFFTGLNPNCIPSIFTFFLILTLGIIHQQRPTKNWLFFSTLPPCPASSVLKIHGCPDCIGYKYMQNVRNAKFANCRFCVFDALHISPRWSSFIVSILVNVLFISHRPVHDRSHWSPLWPDFFDEWPLTQIIFSWVYLLDKIISIIVHHYTWYNYIFTYVEYVIFLSGRSSTASNNGMCS